MKKNEQDILNIVKEELENVEVPESLSPAQIEKKLLEMSPPKEAKKKKLYYNNYPKIINSIFCK